MKKLLLFIILMSSLVVSAQDTTKYTRNGNVFTKVTTNITSKDTRTDFIYVIKGISYPIWITPNGRCYILRISKKGNQYKQYLSEDIAKEICSELKIVYIELNN